MSREKLKYCPTSIQNLQNTLNPQLITEYDFSRIWHHTLMMRPIAFYHHAKNGKLLMNGFRENVPKPKLLTLNPP